MKNDKRKSLTRHCFFCTCWYNHVVLILYFTYVVYHVYWSVDIVLTLHPWNKSHLVMPVNLSSNVTRTDNFWIVSLACSWKSHSSKSLFNCASKSSQEMGPGFTYKKQIRKKLTSYVPFSVVLCLPLRYHKAENNSSPPVWANVALKHGLGGNKMSTGTYRFIGFENSIIS